MTDETNQGAREQSLAEFTAEGIDCLRNINPTCRAVREWEARPPELPPGLALVSDPDGAKLHQSIQRCLTAAELTTAQAVDALGLSLVLEHVLRPWIEAAEGSRRRHNGWCTGTIHPPEALILRQHAGDGVDAPTGNRYSLAVQPGGMPAVQSGQSGRTWTASWDDLVDLAKAAGVDLPQEYQPPSALSEESLAKGLGAELPPVGHPVNVTADPEPEPSGFGPTMGELQPHPTNPAPAEGLTLRPAPAAAGAGAGASSPEGGQA